MTTKQTKGEAGQQARQINTVLKRFDERFTYASFCWKSDSANGLYFAKLTKRNVKLFIRRALQGKIV